MNAALLESYDEVYLYALSGKREHAFTPLKCRLTLQLLDDVFLHGTMLLKMGSRVQFMRSPDNL